MTGAVAGCRGPTPTATLAPSPAPAASPSLPNGGDQSSGGPLVGAYYYPWYGKPGQWEQAIANKPILGRYDSRDPPVIDRHVEWARRAGIDFFAMSWWGPDSWEDGALQGAYLRSQDVLPFAIHYESAGRLHKPEDAPIDFEESLPSGETRGERFVADMAYLADSYLHHPAYATVDGRPIVVLYLARVWRNYAPYVDEVRRMMEETGVDPYIVADVVWWNPANQVAWGWEPAAASFDAITGYSLYDYGQPGVMVRFTEEAGATAEVHRDLAGSFDLDFVPNVMPGFDDRRLRGVDRSVIARRGGATFEEQWRTATDLADDEHPMVLVTSFNEWHEGTEIEPSQEHGDSYLQLLSRLQNDS